MSGGKSHMRTESVDELLLVKYLLGNLTEEEQVQVEDRAFADRDYMGALDAAEADLIDAYVSGELAQADRRGIRASIPGFAATPEQGGVCPGARHARSQNQCRRLAPPERHSAGQSFLALIGRWNPVLTFAAATAALICVTGGTWLMVQNVSMRSRVSAMEARRRDLRKA